MVYINKDGTITTSQQWGISKVMGIFYGVISMVIFFFKSLFGFDTSSSAGSFRGSSGYRGSGGGGGGSGGGGGGGGGPGKGNKRFFTMRDINPPTIGGCPGGACGR